MEKSGFELIIVLIHSFTTKLSPKSNASSFVVVIDGDGLLGLEIRRVAFKREICIHISLSPSFSTLNLPNHAPELDPPLLLLTPLQSPTCVHFFFSLSVVVASSLSLSLSLSLSPLISSQKWQSVGS